MKTTIVLSTLLLFLTLLAACKVSSPAVSPSDTVVKTIAPSQVATPTPTPTPRPAVKGPLPHPGAPPGVTPPPFDPPDTMLTPPIPRKEMPIPKTKEEFAAWNAQRQKELEEAGINKPGQPPYSSITKAFGPETRGATVNFPGKGRLVKLPDDAYIAFGLVRVECAAGTKCPKFPSYVIARGNSQISIDANGEIWEEKMAQGEEGAFDFLKESLKK